MDEYVEGRGNPNQPIDYRNDRAIIDALDVIGLELKEIDINFLTQLRIENPNFESEEIKIPTLKVIEVVTERQAIIRVNEYWEREVESYIDEDNLANFIDDMTSDNAWWNGEKVDEDIYDEETTNAQIIVTKRIR